jgi:hypothetical protein
MLSNDGVLSTLHSHLQVLLHTFVFLAILTSWGIHTKSALKVCNTIIVVSFNESLTPIIIIFLGKSLHHLEVISWHTFFNYTIVVMSSCLHRYYANAIMLLCLHHYYAIVVVLLRHHCCVFTLSCLHHYYTIIIMLLCCYYMSCTITFFQLLMRLQPTITTLATKLFFFFLIWVFFFGFN